MMQQYRLQVLLMLVAAVISFGCSSQRTTNAPVQAPSTAPTPVGSPLTGFQRDLQFIRNGQYTYVLVISRKDGKPLDKEDGEFLRKNAPQVVDWVMSDEGRKAIGGTNFNFEQGNMDLLKKRFVVEDYSGR